jgi:hypothetical protein
MNSHYRARGFSVRCLKDWLFWFIWYFDTLPCHSAFSADGMV